MLNRQIRGDCKTEQYAKETVLKIGALSEKITHYLSSDESKDENLSFTKEECRIMFAGLLLQNELLIRCLENGEFKDGDIDE